MDLYSGMPYWAIKNPLEDYFHPLAYDYSVDVLVVGSGITGALVSHELCKAGIPCAVVDKRTLSTGSSVASTALLQYEIDTPLNELAEMMEESKAVECYRACLRSITDLENVFREIRYDPSFERVGNVFYASNRKGYRMLKKEYEIRRKYELPVEFWDEEQLQKNRGIKAPAALINHASAQMDPYEAATHLIEHHRKKNELDVFTHTEIREFEEKRNGYELITGEGHKIKCKYLVVAAGFEADFFLPKHVMDLTSTYAILSEPLDEKYFWPEKSLLWETADPYLYVRTTGNRIMLGGEDEEFSNPVKRDRLLRSKVGVLEKKINKLFPDIPFKTEMAWCGTFSSTEDGLPFIGSWPGKKRMFFALGYGGNGITYSMIAAQIITRKLKGIKDDREELFGFERLK